MHVINLLWTINEVAQNKTEKLDTEKTIGRADGSTFQVLDAQVSGNQAVIRSEGSSVIIQNVSKKNNIEVNGAIVAKGGGSATLSDPSVILMGTTTLDVRIVTFDGDVTLDANCTNCSKPIPGGTKVCPWCGATQSTTERLTVV